MLDDLVHGGTGDEGLRLFGSLVHQSQAERSDPKEELYLTGSFTTRRQPMEEFIKNLRAKEIPLAISGGSMDPTRPIQTNWLSWALEYLG